MTSCQELDSSAHLDKRSKQHDGSSNSLLDLHSPYHETDCHAEKMVRYFQGQGHSEGLYSQDMTVSTMPSRLLVSLQPNVV